MIYPRCCAADADTNMWIQFVPMNCRPTMRPDMHLSNPWDRSFHYSPTRPIWFGWSKRNWMKNYKFFFALFRYFFQLHLLTATAMLNVNGPSGSLLHRKPASIFGSIISMADIASSSPNRVWWCTSSPSCNSVMNENYCSPDLSSTVLRQIEPLTAPKNSPVISFQS